jgi:ATP-dependent helicase/nuclease subunit A
MDDGALAWRMPADESPEVIRRALDARRAKAAAERLRLLYVALTRAQCWLVVAAAGETTQEDCWYNIVRAGMDRAGAIPLADGTMRLSHGAWPENGAAERRVETGPAPLPPWTRTAPPAMDRASGVLSPSDLGGLKVLEGEASGLGEDEAKRQGSELHLLLEHLSTSPETLWDRIAETLIPEARRRDARLAEARAVMAAPGLASLFGPGALVEAAVVGEIGGRPFLGSIDRLIVESDRVLAVDYKTNRVIPDHPEAVPEGILRQMGAYAALLEPLYPGRRIDTAILWTKGPVLMPLPGALVMAALRRAGFP